MYVCMYVRLVLCVSCRAEKKNETHGPAKLMTMYMKDTQLAESPCMYVCIYVCAFVFMSVVLRKKMKHMVLLC